MARILPNTPTGTATPEVMRVYQLLRQLPDESFFVWHRISLWDQPGPDFWVLDNRQRAILLKVSSATLGQVKAVLQPSLFAAPAPEGSVGEPEQEALRQFQKNLDYQCGETVAPAAVLFPNLTIAALQKLPQANRTRDVKWVAEEDLSPGNFDGWLDRHMSQPLTKAGITMLRKAFTPEVIVPAAYTARKPIERRTEAGLSEYLLDFRQEAVLKTDLELTSDAQTAANDYGIRLVNGVAGSGKSLIIVYRAHLLRRLFPKKKILVLTHNRPLIRDLRTRYEKLSNGDRSVEWYTFLAWCRRHWPDEVPYEVVGFRKRSELITECWHAYLADTAVTEQMLQEEIDWFKDRLLFGRGDYLAADRVGRGFALPESMRHKVYDAMKAYHKVLYTEGLLDWGDIPRRMWNLINSRQAKSPIYDVILIDEAQFFAPIWFEIIKRILRPTTGHLFLVADPTQGFLKRRQSWLASGLDVRGRAHRLSKSYRTTRQILDFATLLYRTRLPEDEEEEEIVTPNLLDMPSGALPVVIPLTSPQDEATRVLNEIRELIKAGVPLDYILVIHADRWEVERLIGRLMREFGPETAVDPGQIRDSSGRIRVCSLHAATGLEAPIVFLLGVHALYEEEQSVRLAEGERAELIRDNTRKLYMACTRASQRLVLTYVGDLPKLFQCLLRDGSPG